MKPSEIMRRGCELRPNKIEYVLIDDKQNASCALGALIEGYAGHRFTAHTLEAFTHFAQVLKPAMPFLNNVILCPVCHRRQSVTDTIVDLNNTHGWSREQIGHWLDQFAGTNETPEKGERNADVTKTTEMEEREEVFA